MNYFSGSPLNRVSWLRPSQTYLNALVEVPNVRWILFNSGKPLMTLGEGEDDGLPSTSTLAPAYLNTQDMRSVLGQQPYFGQGKDPGDLLLDTDSEHDKHFPTEAARHRGLRIVFLGLQENEVFDNTTAVRRAAVRKPEGIPYFSADLSDLEYGPEDLKRFLGNTVHGRERKTLFWSEPLLLMSTLDAFTAGLFASAKSMVDWNTRNKFCPGCGSPSYSMWGGWKIACSSHLPWATKTNKRECFTAKGLHNFTHPRTDPVVIMIAIDKNVDKILLGRGRKYPGNYYSAPAGFIEPGESLEDAVAREMWEETGVRVWNVKYHSGQPWPFPANLMVGFYAQADSTQPIRIDLDNELVDARWFTRQEIKSVLDHPMRSGFRREDYQKMTEKIDGRSNAEPSREPTAQVLTPSVSGLSINSTGEQEVTGGYLKPPFRVPPATAIAGVMIRDWINGKIGFHARDLGDLTFKGNF